MLISAGSTAALANNNHQCYSYSCYESEKNLFFTMWTDDLHMISEHYDYILDGKLFVPSLHVSSNCLFLSLFNRFTQ